GRGAALQAGGRLTRPQRRPRRPGAEDRPGRAHQDHAGPGGGQGDLLHDRLAPFPQDLLKGGQAVVEEVPLPTAGTGMVLVRTAWSVLSAGTERAALRSGEASAVLERAADPSTFARAIDLLRREGPAAVWDRVRAAAEGQEIAPGYSASGIVQE